MPRIGKYTHVYYSILRSNNPNRIFADEIDKQKFLDLIRLNRNEMDFEIHAYCIMDNEVHLLVGADNAKLLSKILKKIMNGFVSYYSGIYPQQKDCISESHHKLKKEDCEYILKLCSRIHSIPLENSVAKRLGDYWWSSYNDYMGKYFSGIVETETLMNFIDIDKQRALKKFRMYHKKQFI